VLGQVGIFSNSPKSVIRDLAQQGFIEDPKVWLKFLLARNYTSHTYEESTARWVFEESKLFIVEAEFLLSRLERECAV
jgi:nucleotidyltransferase substrate binding protein (TIGR01987 family)